MHTSHVLTHVITANAVNLEEQAIGNALACGKYTERFNLTPGAQEVLVAAAERAVTGAGAVITSKTWLPRADGSVEVLFGLPTEEELVLAKLALS